MDIGNQRPDAAAELDPRARLAQEKFFTMRPKPLERWLWRQNISAAAERIFWFHWSEGARSGDWCSQFALHWVAQECEVDASTVTRSYQILKRLGVIRRIDPGRDTRNPFAQATCITEVLVPADLLAKLNGIPNRPRLRASAALGAGAHPTAPAPAPPAAAAPVRPTDPHQHLTLKERRERHKTLTEGLSAAERERWHRALCGTALRIEFDATTRVSPAIQAEMQQYLAARPAPEAPTKQAVAATPATSGNRRLSVFDLARLRREIQRVAGLQNSDEVSRQVLWAIESAAGSLRQFAPAHALNIALKKLREGQWTRPNRMPPNWVRQVRDGAAPETCSRA